MQLRAYILSKGTKTETSAKKLGDVISIHDMDNPVPDDKGPTFKEFLVLQNWDDAALAADMEAKGEKLRAYPYAIFDENDQFVVRSTEYIDFNLLSTNLRNRLLDPNQTVSITAYQQVSAARKTR